MTEARAPLAKSSTPNWLPVVGLFLVPAFFALLQGWAVRRTGVAWNVTARLLLDGRLYLTQALQLQDEPFTPLRILEFGLYPLFLSQFDLGVKEWATNDSKLLTIYYAQSLMLCATSAVFLLCAFMLIPGHPLKRIIVSLILGCILLSPLVIVWPNFILTEAMVLPAILLFACACLADDRGKRWSAILIAMACCLLVLVRDAMIIFVCMFAALFLVNILFAKINWARPTMIGAVLVLFAVGLGGAKALLVVGDGSKNVSQLLANIIQIRILPDPEHRKFFAERGLPISPTVMERSGTPAWVDNDWFEPDSALSDRPDLVAYRHWVVAKGPQTYMAFLLTHPWYLLRSIFYSPNVPHQRYWYEQDLYFSITDLITVPYKAGYGTRYAPYPLWLRDFLLAPFGWLIPLIYLVAAAKRYIWQTATRQRISNLDSAAIAASGAVFVNYHVDAWGLWPHTVPFLVLIYIALIPGTAGIVRELVPLIRSVIARLLSRSTPKNGMSTLHSTASRLHTVGAVAVLIICFGVVWDRHRYFAPDDTRFSTPRPPIGKQVTAISELPPLPNASNAPDKWDLIEGLNAEVVEGPAAASGQRILRLVAVGADVASDGRHALGVYFGGLVPGEVYRAIAWVKVKPGVRVMIEARDGVDPRTGKPSNYGAARADVAASAIVDSTGDILASGVEAARDDWVKVWVDLRSNGGQLVVSMGFLEGRNNRHIFKAAGQQLTFGGFEISLARSVQALSRDSSSTPSPPRTPTGTQVTTISELPPFPSSSNAPDKWDLIEGLNAEVVEGSAVASGQRMLRLVAVGADAASDGRHALGVRFGGLVPGEVYRAIAWVKVEPGVRVMIEARDGVDPLTGKPSNYGAARADVAASAIIDSTGDIRASGVEAAGDGWVKLWVDLRNNDGQLFVTIGFLEGRNNRHIFRAAGQQLTFGGFEISPARSVQALSRDSASTPRPTGMQVTTISELPPLPRSSNAPDKWDLIEGLNAGVVEGSAVASGQRMLRLVAVGADAASDGRHALGVRFGGVVAGEVYRAIAWVKVEPGVRVMIEARDAVDPRTGKPSNYGAARADLAAGAIVDSSGDIRASGVEAAGDGWVKVWVDLRNNDGQFFVTIGFLEGRNNRHVFRAAGQQLTFGGFEISPAR